MNVRLKKDDKIKVLNSDDLYEIMQKVLKRENKIDRNREHLWVISLDVASKILAVELVAKGSLKGVQVEPMEVYSVPLQKRAAKIIIVHNHPSGELEPSEADKDLTDQLIQAGLLLKTPVLDHLIISEETYYSMAGSGLLAKLENGTKYVPNYKLKERYKKEGADRKAEEMAKVLKEKGIDVNIIAETTGLTEAQIKKLNQ